MSREKHRVTQEGALRPVSAQPGPASLAVGIAAVVGLASAWIAVGATGLMAHALRHALTGLGLAAAVGIAWPSRRFTPALVIWLALLPVAGIALAPWSEPTLNALAVPLVFLWLERAHDGADRQVLRCVLWASLVLVLYRILRNCVPWLWLLSDGVASGMGAAAGWAVGRSLKVGATFGGIDFLVTMAAGYGVWLASTPSPRRNRAIWASVSLCALHGVYLIALAFASDLLDAVPAAPAHGTPAGYPSDPGPRTWLRDVLPWHLPAVGAALHLLGAMGALRWSLWLPAADADARTGAAGRRSTGDRGTNLLRPLAVAVACALALGFSATLCVGRSSLSDRKIVIYERGFLNWLKPKHEDYGRLSIGMYGLLPHFLQSLGANCVVSPALTAEALRGADVLVLIYPDEPWAPGQLDAVWRFVREGGSLWLLGEHTVRERDGRNRFNELLEPTGIRVVFDSATYAVGGWLQSFDALAHPCTAGVRDDRNQFGIVIGASLSVRWPARPLIAGRWGWSDWGDEGHSSMMGDGRYNSGEKLGDVVLAAEQSFGKGKILVFGDTSSLSNGINMGSYPFTSRAFSYLANGAHGPHSLWRGLLCVAAALMGAYALRRYRPAAVVASIAGLALAQGLGILVSRAQIEVVPDGTKLREHDLALIDSSHLGLFSAESWRDDGLMGLALNLMRNGYLTLTMSDFSASALERADLFVSVAPARAYTRAERKDLDRFVRGGGILILCVGYDERIPSQALLEDFGFSVGGDGPAGFTTGPLPLGFFKSPYYDTGQYRVYVRFHAAWPVKCSEPDARVLAYGPGDQPVMMMRRVDRGKVVVVGDTAFAMNQNLEVESGAPFEGMRENPHFWRWLLTYLQDKPLWIPPNPKAPVGDPARAGATPAEESP